MLNMIYVLLKVNCNEKRIKINKKRPGLAHFKKSKLKLNYIDSKFASSEIECLEYLYDKGGTHKIISMEKGFNF